MTVWGSVGDGDGQFSYLESGGGLATDSAGNVYVTDTHNHRIQKFTSSGTFIREWGVRGAGNGQVDHPFGVAVDATGRVYVADTGNGRIQRFTSDGSYLTQWKNTSDGELDGPRSIARDSASGYFFVADTGNHRIQKFTSNGTFVAKWGSHGIGDGEFRYPVSVAIDGAGYVYVYDGDNFRIQKFTSNGVFVTKWGSQGSGNGQFMGVWGIAIDSTNHIYVNDIMGVQKFDSNGNFIAKWTVGGYAITIDPNDQVYVFDLEYDTQNLCKVKVFSTNGTPVREWGGSCGAGDGELADFSGKSPGLGSDSSGNFFVADTGNHRIQKFTSTGTFLTKWGNPGTGNGKFLFPGGVIVDPTGNVYVADSDNNRIQKFTYGTIPANSTLNVSKAGQGAGTITSVPSGIDCGSDCTELYLWGAIITLTAQSDLSSTFSGWVGCYSANGNQCIIDMTGDQAVTATFTLPSQLSINEGAIGSEFIISGSGFGSKKGKVLIRDVAAKVVTWADDRITGLVTKVPPPGGPYDVTINLKSKPPASITLENAFTVKLPEIDSLDVIKDIGTPDYHNREFLRHQEG